MTEGSSVSLGIDGSFVQYSMEALCCVLEQDTLSSAKNWFNLGRHKCLDMTENC